MDERESLALLPEWLRASVDRMREVRIARFSGEVVFDCTDGVPTKIKLRTNVKRFRRLEEPLLLDRLDG